MHREIEMIMSAVIIGILLPSVGTMLGSAFVFFSTIGFVLMMAMDVVLG